MATRGPDDEGLWTSPDGRAALGHRRLAIINLSRRGAQPMVNADGRYVLSLNGEIYNYRELRAKLQDAHRHLTSRRLKIGALEARHYMQNQLLRDTDWASMAFSLEVRPPFVDWPLWKRISRLPRELGPRGKRAMALAPRKHVPDGIVKRAKTSFAIPTGEWITAKTSRNGGRRGLQGWVELLYARHRNTERA